jgi:signal transduction histidine kinase
VTLTVMDDGIGIPSGGRRSGLANLAERAQQLSGRFSADPGSGGGTVLVWSVPIQAAGED